MFTERQYTELIAQANAKKIRARRGLPGARNGEPELKREIARADIEGRLTAIQGNPLLNDKQKAKQSIPLFGELNKQNAARIEELQATAAAAADEGERHVAESQIADLSNEQTELKKHIKKLWAIQ